MPCRPALAPVASDAQATALLYGKVDRSAPWEPSAISEESTGIRPSAANRSHSSSVAPSNPTIRVRAMASGAVTPGGALAVPLGPQGQGVPHDVQVQALAEPVQDAQIDEGGPGQV